MHAMFGSDMSVDCVHKVGMWVPMQNVQMWTLAQSTHVKRLNGMFEQDIVCEVFA